MLGFHAAFAICCVRCLDTKIPRFDTLTIDRHSQGELPQAMHETVMAQFKLFQVLSFSRVRACECSDVHVERLTLFAPL